MPPIKDSELRQLLKKKDQYSVLLALKDKFKLAFPDAVKLLHDFEVRNSAGQKEIGLSALVYAFGGYREDLISCFEYPAHHYNRLPEGTPIIHLVFDVFRDTDGCIKLGEIFGLKDLFDFNEHKIQNDKIDYKKMAELIREFGHDDEAIQSEVDRLKKLVDAGFELMFFLTEVGE